jgi:hypothetical protein
LTLYHEFDPVSSTGSITLPRLGIPIHRTVVCVMCGESTTLAMKSSTAERQVLLAGRPDPLDTWFCDECFQTFERARTEEAS